MTITNPIEKLFRQRGRDLPYPIRLSNDDSFEYSCLESTIKAYRKGQVYTVYQIPPIIRIIGKKLNLYTKKLQRIVQEEDQTLPVIISWSENRKEVLLLNCDQKDLINENFALLVESAKEETKNWIESLTDFQKENQVSSE
ncbi:MAG: hypothetical protein NXH75_15115 [Halobacteriovoraceae bacterium]|nr:hypothetical protein [Halobacteriovoraceae bacterium]